MRQSSLTLVAPAVPRAPSTALLSVFWAALGLLAALGVHQASKGYDLTAALGAAPLARGEVFEAQLKRVNAGGVEVQLGIAREEGEPVVHRAAIKVGDDYLALPEEFFGGGFTELLVSPDGRRWLAVEAFDTEAMGDLQLVASDDGGRTFVHRGTLSWPTYQAQLDQVSFDGDEVEVRFSLDDDAELQSEWWTWLERLRARVFDDEYGVVLPAGHYRVRSKNGGRTFGRLQRL